MRDNKLHSLSVIIASAAASSACAQIGLGFGGGISFQSTHEVVPGTNEFRIDGSFVFDPTQGGWEKTLLAPPGGWQPGARYAMHEFITFFPDPTRPSFALSDWHERIELGSDGQIWDVWKEDPIMFGINGAPAPGLMTMFDPSFTEVWFLFDPIEIGPNGVTLEIWKEFCFIGQVPMFDPVRVYEYPTPAPGAAALLGIAGLFSARRRR